MVEIWGERGREAPLIQGRNLGSHPRDLESLRVGWGTAVFFRESGIRLTIKTGSGIKIPFVFGIKTQIFWDFSQNVENILGKSMGSVTRKYTSLWLWLMVTGWLERERIPSKGWRLLQWMILLLKTLSKYIFKLCTADPPFWQLDWSYVLCGQNPMLINSYSSRTRRIWADIYNQRGRRPSWLLSAHIRQVREE